MPSRSRARHPRGYALIMCIMFGLMLASLTAAAMWAAGRDAAEARVQENGVRALYAAEAAAATVIEQLRLRMVSDPTPNITDLAPPTLPGVTYPPALFRVNYIDGSTLQVQPSPDTQLSLIETGPNSGLVAQQTPIQVLVTADVGGSRATISNAINAQQIPVFQFALFFNGDAELINPGAMTLRGRIHANGNIHLAANRNFPVRLETRGISSGNGFIHRCSIHSPVNLCTETGDTTSDIFIFDGIQPLATPDTWPRLTKGREDNTDDAAQRDYLTGRFGEVVTDKSIQTHPVRVPIQLPAGTVLPTIAGRPEFCPGDSIETASTGPDASFAQSAEIAIIKRPTGAYGTGTYSAANPAGPWDSNYGPIPGDAPGTNVTDCPLGSFGSARCQALAGNRSVPLSQVTYESDDAGVRDERMYWKADIRIIDGIWYKKNDIAPVFDPENYNMNGLPDTDPVVQLGYAFARVLRYSWFWDPREGRVYASAPKYQRGGQMRVTDFDVYAFNELLKNPAALAMLLPSGIPDNGVVVYISETYDPTFEDANASSNPTVAHANVRNFLDFHVMDDGQELTPADGIIGHVAPARNSGLTPGDLGWHPAKLWGILAPPGFNSLTPSPNKEFLADPQVETTNAAAVQRLGNTRPLPAPAAQVFPDNANWKCLETMSLTTASYADPPPAPCIQSGATAMGPENAVRVVRAQQMGCNGIAGCAATDNRQLGLTIATDNRLYIYGDVNVTSATSATCTTAPCQKIPGRVAFIADSVTILSQRFNDRVMQRGGDETPQGKLLARARFSSMPGQRAAVGVNTPYIAEQFDTDDDGGGPNVCSILVGQLGTRLREAVSTTVNASYISGDVPSCPASSTAASGVDGNSSGGLANFPRFLEDWKGKDSIINGSQVSLYRAEQGNSRFRISFVGGFDYTPDQWVRARSATPYKTSPTSSDHTACTYAAPNRLWGFDDALLSTTENNLPPGTPRVFAVERLRWTRR